MDWKFALFLAVPAAVLYVATPLFRLARIAGAGLIHKLEARRLRLSR